MGSKDECARCVYGFTSVAGPGGLGTRIVCPSCRGRWVDPPAPGPTDLRWRLASVENVDRAEARLGREDGRGKCPNCNGTGTTTYPGPDQIVIYGPCKPCDGTGRIVGTRR